MSLAVDKVKKRVTITMSDDARLEGNIFLSPVSELGVGEQTVLEALTSDDSFIPFETTDGEYSFINLRRIMMLSTPVEEASEEADPEDCKLNVQASRVVVFLLNGQMVRGEVCIDMPEGKARLSDWLNQLDRFLVLRDELGETLINLKFVLRVALVASAE